MFLYSDGGPDHRSNLSSAKLATIYLFMQLDLEFYLVVCPALSQSYRNSVERPTFTLNLSLQNIVLNRSLIGETMKKKTKDLTNLKKVKAATEKDSSLQDEVNEVLQPVCYQHTKKAIFLPEVF